MVEEGQHAVGYRVPGRLVARHGQQDHEVTELVRGERLPVLRLHQRADDVLARAGPALLGQLQAVADQLGPGGHGLRLVLRVVRADHLIGPVEDLAAVLLRHPEQLGDGLQRQLAGHVGDEVTGAVGHRGGHDPPGPVGEHLPQAADGPRREAPGDDPAQLGVPGWIAVEQDEPGQLQGFLGDRQRIADERGLRLARIDVAVMGHVQHVRVPGDHPVPVVVEPPGAPGLLAPPDRGGPAQLGQFLNREPLQAQIGIGEVESGRDVRRGHQQHITRRRPAAA